MPIINPKTCCQICIVTRNIEKTALQYAELFGVPVPVIMHIPTVELARTIYRGEPSATQARMCVFDMGQVCLEIMEPDEHDSSWKEALGNKDVAFHHIGFMIEDVEKTTGYFAKMDCPERQHGNYPPNGTYLIPDSADLYGLLFNLKYEPNRQ